MTYKKAMREPMRDDPVRMTLYMEKSTREALRKLAKARGLSISQLVEELAKEKEVVAKKGLTLMGKPKSAKGAFSSGDTKKRKTSTG